MVNINSNTRLNERNIMTLKRYVKIAVHRLYGLQKVSDIGMLMQNVNIMLVKFAISFVRVIVRENLEDEFS